MPRTGIASYQLVPTRSNRSKSGQASPQLLVLDSLLSQLVRALALRVLTSIRVKDIVQIQILVITQCLSDTSAYVRKAACLAIPKVSTLDPDSKDECISLISRALGDKAVSVSALYFSVHLALTDLFRFWAQP